MKELFFIVLMVSGIAFSKSAEQIALDKACRKDMSVSENVEKCLQAIRTICGEARNGGERVVEACAPDNLEKKYKAVIKVMIARSKASEIVPAFAAYIKLQEAYAVESGELGTWSQIGYSAPGGKNFYYSEYDQGDIKGIQTINKENLAGCPANSKWIAQCYYEDYRPVCNYSIQSSKKKACENVTLNFLSL